MIDMSQTVDISTLEFSQFITKKFSEKTLQKIEEVILKKVQ